MKIFIGKKMCCGANYVYPLLRNYLYTIGEIVEDVSIADFIVFPATCCGNLETIEYVLNNMLNTISHKKETAKTFVTGCLTRNFKNPEIAVYIQQFLNEYFDYVIPEDNYEEIVNIIKGEKILSSDFGASHQISLKELNLYISRGCKNNCSFCKMAYLDLPTKSVDFNDINLNLLSLDKNINTINIWGTNIAQYGIDFAYQYNLMDVVHLIHNIPQIENINLYGFAFKDAIRNHFSTDLKYIEKVKFIQGSIETGSPRLLYMMNKGYEILELLNFWKEVQSMYFRKLSTDIIAGFPTETYEDIELTLDVVGKLKPKEVRIHKYQNSYFVPSNKYEQLSQEKIQEHYEIYKHQLKKITKIL